MSTKLTRLLLVFLVFGTLQYSVATPLSEIDQFADGLNIEGGLIPQNHLNKTQTWASLCFINDITP